MAITNELRATNRSEVRSSDFVPWLASFVCHVGFLLVLAVWVLSPGQDSQGVVLVGGVSESDEVDLELGQSQPTAPVETESTFSSPQTSLAFDLEVDLQVNLSQAQPATDSSLVSAIAASAQSSASAFGREIRDGKQGAAFLGAYAVGERFVFVLDSSTSMTGQRWVYACNQLIDSLTSLSPDQEFFIISFDLRPGFLFSRQPTNGSFYRNDKATVAKVRRWLKSKILGRGTRPAKAMMHALAMQPDAIFLLSDGELQDDTAFQLQMHNRPQDDRPQIPIHTIHLFSLDGRGTLQMIARDNGGTFTPVGQR